jgi:hypothetical protein
MYGPWNLYNDIGEFFETNDMFIQDPRSCDRDVRYCNPHRLSSLTLENCTWTSQLYNNQDFSELKDVGAGTELLELLDSQSNLAEAAQPLAISTALERYVPPSHIKHRGELCLTSRQTPEASTDFHAPAREGVGVQREHGGFMGHC